MCSLYTTQCHLFPIFEVSLFALYGQVKRDKEYRLSCNRFTFYVYPLVPTHQLQGNETFLEMLKEQNCFFFVAFGQDKVVEVLNPAEYMVSKCEFKEELA